MNKKQQLKQQFEQLAQKFGYEIKELDFTHNTNETIEGDNSVKTEFDMVALKMTTTDFSDTVVEDTEDDSLKDIREDFYKTVVDSNINFYDLPPTHPLSIVLTMFLLAQEGDTDYGWQIYAYLLDSLKKTQEKQHDTI